MTMIISPQTNYLPSPYQLSPYEPPHIARISLCTQEYLFPFSTSLSSHAASNSKTSLFCQNETIREIFTHPLSSLLLFLLSHSYRKTLSVINHFQWISPSSMHYLPRSLFPPNASPSPSIKYISY